MPRPRTAADAFVDLLFPLTLVGAAIFAFAHDWEKAIGSLLWGVFVLPIWAYRRWRGGHGWRIVR